MLTYLDQTVESLFAGLKERGVEECVNVIIVSDHGMAPFDSKKVIHLKKVRHVHIYRIAGKFNLAVHTTTAKLNTYVDIVPPNLNLPILLFWRLWTNHQI